MTWLFVFCGGGLGAMARYGLSFLVPRTAGGFPWATFCANMVGALLIGLLAGTLLSREGARGFWIVGVLGGFTTFSAFSLETVQLIQQRDMLLALIYVVASVLMGLLACWLGMRMVGHA